MDVLKWLLMKGFGLVVNGCVGVVFDGSVVDGCVGWLLVDVLELVVADEGIRVVVDRRFWGGF